MQPALVQQRLIAQPQLAIAQPQLAYTQPRLALAQPQLAIAQPHLAYTQPRLAIAQPQLAIAQPQLAYTQPQLAVAPRVAVAQPTILAKQVEDFDSNPQYSFAYDVQDSLTGDSKSQQETRNGDLVQGQYSLIDADGYQRIVSYTADSVNGFNAVVQREPLVARTIAQPALVKSVVAQPALVKSVVAQPAAIIAQPQPILRSAYSPFVQQPIGVVGDIRHL